MQAQATFTIDGHTFHLGSNGYPENAAHLLAAAAMQPATNPARPGDSGFADDFCRANPVRLVRYGTRPSDIRYHYDVQTLGGDREPRRQHVMAYERRGRVPAFGDKWECFYSGTLEDFLLAYAHCEEVELAGA